MPDLLARYSKTLLLGTRKSMIWVLLSRIPEALISLLFLHLTLTVIRFNIRFMEMNVFGDKEN